MNISRFFFANLFSVFVISGLLLLISPALKADSIRLNEKLERTYLEPAGSSQQQFLKAIPRQGLISYLYNQNTSSVMFTLNHLGITAVAGEFQEFTGAFQFDPVDIKKTTAQISILTGTVDCNSSFWDKKLMGPSYFDSGKFPEIKFSSREVFNVKKNRFDILGNLTIRDITKPVVFRVDILGMIKNEQGYEQMTFKAYAIISREEFHLGMEDFIGKAGLFFKEELKLILEVKGLPIAEQTHV